MFDSAFARRKVNVFLFVFLTEIGNDTPSVSQTSNFEPLVSLKMEEFVIITFVS